MPSLSASYLQVSLLLSVTTFPSKACYLWRCLLADGKSRLLRNPGFCPPFSGKLSERWGRVKDKVVLIGRRRRRDCGSIPYKKRKIKIYLFDVFWVMLKILRGPVRGNDNGNRLREYLCFEVIFLYVSTSAYLPQICLHFIFHLTVA